MLAAALLLACDGTSDTGPTDSDSTDSATPTGTSTTGDTGPSGHSATTDTDAPPDLATLTRSLQASIDVLPTLTMVPCYEAWRSVSGDQDLTCPLYFIVEANQFAWESICVTRQGTTYGGILTTTFDQTDYVNDQLAGPVLDRFGEELIPTWTDDLPFEEDGRNGIGMDGSVAVHMPGSVDPDFVFGGQGTSTTVTSRGLTLRHHKLEGLCQSGLGTEGTWLGAGLDPWLDVNQLSTAAVDGFLTTVNGSLSGLPSPYSAVSYEELTLRPEALPGTYDPADAPPAARCDLEPSGALELREDGGRVWRITFDPAGSCDGCGALTTLDGASFGDVCADFTPLNRPMAETALSGLPGGIPGVPSGAREVPVSSPVPVQVSTPRTLGPPPPRDSASEARFTLPSRPRRPSLQELSP